MGDIFEEISLHTPHQQQQGAEREEEGNQHGHQLSLHGQLAQPSSHQSHSYRNKIRRQESAPRRSSIHGSSSSRRDSDQFNQLKADFAIVLRRRRADACTSDAKDRTEEIKRSLMQADLDVEEIRSFDERQSILLVCAENGRTLQRAAEKMKLKMQTHGGTWKEFRITELRDFVNEQERHRSSGSFLGGGGYGKKTRSLFRSSERQLIIDYIIQTQQSEGYLNMFSEHVEQCMPLQMLDRQNHLASLWSFRHVMRGSSEDDEQGEDAVNDGGRSRRGHCCWRCVPDALNARCRRVVEVCRRLCGLEDSLLDEIRNYYGEEIGFYFAWLSFYTSWLILPSLAGAVDNYCR